MFKAFSNPFCDPTTKISRPEVNPYIQKLKTTDLPLLYGEEIKKNYGAWHRNDASKLILEIGCHKGKTINQMATDHPEYEFLAMDITYKRVVTTAERATKRNLANLRTILCNAAHLDKVFAPGELDAVLLFFPDPWPKTKQNKNRLFSENFCIQIKTVLKPDGYLWVKTDSKDYFDEITAITASQSMKRVANPGTFPNTYCTTFEDKFNQQGLPTYEAYLSR